MSECPAWGKTCSNCNTPHHFSSVCRSSADAKSLFLLAHVHYDANSNMFSTRHSDVQEIKAKLTPINPPNTFATANLAIFPDSGANICLAGISHLSKLNIEPSQLQPCHKRVAAVGGSILVCKGWILVCFEIDGHASTQPLYFCDRVDRIYFSKEGCLETNILPPSFPYPMPKKPANISAIKVHEEAAAEQMQDTVPTQTKRTPPPARPMQLPFPATEENIPHLEAFIIEQFASSPSM